MPSVPATASLSISSIGYLVPRRFDGVVHSVFARACNISCEDALLALLAPGSSDGPTVLLLAHGSPIDLRNYVRTGDAVSLRDARLRSSALVADAGDAMVWRAGPPPTVSSATQVAANLCAARAGIAARVRRRPSVLQREARATCDSLERACRFCDVDHALRDATRLIGWGEGLTPAGDDFLVGLMAGLYALASRPGARRDFLTRLSAATADGAVLTTPVSAYYLRQAAHGHFNASVHRLRAALLSARVTAAVQRIVEDTLALGATSGADLATGMLSGIAAWCHPA